MWPSSVQAEQKERDAEGIFEELNEGSNGDDAPGGHD
jgi:hypothetical protein